MTRQEFIDWAKSRGWAEDRYGHLQKTFPAGAFESGGVTTTRLEPRKYRYKLSRIAVRYESKWSGGWIRLRSGYFSKLSINPDGMLIGMVR